MGRAEGGLGDWWGSQVPQLQSGQASYNKGAVTPKRGPSLLGVDPKQGAEKVTGEGENMRGKKLKGKKHEGKNYAQILKMEVKICTFSPPQKKSCQNTQTWKGVGVVSKEEAQNLALQKRQAEEPIHNMTFHIP